VRLVVSQERAIVVVDNDHRQCPGSLRAARLVEERGASSTVDDCDSAADGSAVSQVTLGVVGLSPNSPTRKLSLSVPKLRHHGEALPASPVLHPRHTQRHVPSVRHR